MAKLVVVGAGPMGLSAAYFAAKRGFEVAVLEAGPKVGGMAAHFDLEGLSIERFYHFCCLSDDDTFALLEELGLSDAMKWVTTRMGYFFEGRLYTWGNPLALLRFPKLGPIEKLRYGLQVYFSTRRRNWGALDKINAEDWLVAWLGRSAYEKMWRPLLYHKFYELSQYVSAAWVWQRIKRLGRSRRSLFEERLGYIDGGSETLVEGLADAIRRQNGTISLQTPATRFVVDNGAIAGVEVQGGATVPADRVICTVPTPYVAQMFPDDFRGFAERYSRIRNIGVVCVVLKLRRSVSENFWVNVSDSRFEIPGIVEFSNLRPLEDTVVYIPFYMPQTHDRFGKEDSYFIEESMRCLHAINPGVVASDLLVAQVSRLRYAQPVYEPNFRAILPNVETEIAGLQIADTAFYYPEDRGVSESIRFAKIMVERLVRP